MAVLSNSGDAASIVALKFWPIRFQSLFKRELVLTALWSAVAIVVTGFFISNVYNKSAERDFQNLLRAHLYHVIDAVKINDVNALVGSPLLADPRFLRPKSGWYWLVEPLGGYAASPLASLSLGGSNLPVATEREAPRNENYERLYNVTDAFGNHVQVIETEVILATDGRAARFRIAGNSALLEKDIRYFSLRLYFALVGFSVSNLIVYMLVGQTRRKVP